MSESLPIFPFNEMTATDLVAFLVGESSEDAVFMFISTISCFGITDRNDAIAAIEKDTDTRKWAEFTASLIPQPYAKNHE